MSAEKIIQDFSNERRLTILEESINNINNTLVRFEKRFDQIDAKFEKIDSKFERLESENKTHFRWVIGSILGLYAMVTSILVTVIVKLVH